MLFHVGRHFFLFELSAAALKIEQRTVFLLRCLVCGTAPAFQLHFVCGKLGERLFFLLRLRAKRFRTSGKRFELLFQLRFLLRHGAYGTAPLAGIVFQLSTQPLQLLNGEKNGRFLGVERRLLRANGAEALFQFTPTRLEALHTGGFVFHIRAERCQLFFRHGARFLQRRRAVLVFFAPCRSAADLFIQRIERFRRCGTQKLCLRDEALLPRRFLPRRGVFFTRGFQIVACALQLAFGFPPQ